MKSSVRFCFVVAVLATFAALFVTAGHAAATGLASPSATPQMQAQSASELAPGSAQLINPEDLVKFCSRPQAKSR